MDVLGEDVDDVGEADREDQRGNDQRHQVELRSETAHRHTRALAALAIDRHARDALQRLGEVGVGEVTHVLGSDRVDDAVCRPLHVHRLHEAAADAGRDDFLDRLLVVLRHGGIRHRRHAESDSHANSQWCAFKRRIVHFLGPPGSNFILNPYLHERCEWQVPYF